MPINLDRRTQDIYTILRKVTLSLSLFAQIAQSVEQRTENPRVGGSIPSLGIGFAGVV